MGRIFLGRSAGGRLVAVKVIRAELAEEPGFRARFAREVAAARKVSGVFTAVLVDADPDGPVPWLATGYVPGPSLAEAVTRHGRLPVSTVATLAAGLAEALHVIHDCGIIHRDLKPSNVLIAADGPRVIDFGISRAAEGSVLTQTGSVMGSPGFMSPEQAEGGEIGPASDVFSLGALLTFAATGEGPFGTGSMPALLYRVVHQPPSLDRLPAELRPIVERCLIKNPGERVTTGELLAELDTAGPAVDWLPAPVTEALGKFAAPVRAAAGPGQLAVPAQRAAGGTLPGEEVAPAAGEPLGAAAREAAEPSHAAARMPAAAAAAPAAVEDRPTSDFLITDPSVPGLPLRLDRDLPPRDYRGQPRHGSSPRSPRDASGLAVSGPPSPAAAQPRAVSPPWSPGQASDPAGRGHAPSADGPSRAAGPPQSPERVPDLAGPGRVPDLAGPGRVPDLGRVSDLAGPGRVSDLAGPGHPSPGHAPSKAGGQLLSPGGVAGPTVGDRPLPGGAPHSPAGAPSSPGGVPSSPGGARPSPGGAPHSPGNAPSPGRAPLPDGAPPSASGPYGGSRPSVLASARMQRALAAAVAQPPPSRFGRGPGGLSRRGGLWLLICSILVAVAAVALVLLTGFGQHPEPSSPRQAPSTTTGVKSSPAALHQPAQAAARRPGLTHVAAGDAAQAGAGAGAGASGRPPASSTPSAHAQAPAANTSPNPKSRTSSKRKPAATPTHRSSGRTTPAAAHYSRAVPGSQAWTDTGIVLHAGDRVSITASGEILVGPANGESPAGDPACTPATNFPTQSGQFPAPSLPCWSLIARVGSGAPVEVGTGTRLTATGGTLYLGVNAASFPASPGSWAADITVGGAAASS